MWDILLYTCIFNLEWPKKSEEASSPGMIQLKHAQAYLLSFASFS